MSWQLRRLPVCASTEIELDRWLERRQASGLSLQRLAVTARRQRFGHGQQGRPWLSPAGGLWLSAAMPWAGALPGTASLGLAVAVGLAQQLEALVADHDQRCAGLAHRFEGTQDVIFLGRGINYPIALEGALKLKEISYIHAEGYPAGEMKHGPIALLDAKVPVVSIAMPGKVFDKVLSNAQEAKARDAQLIGVAPNCPDAELFDLLLPVPVVDELLSPLLTVIPMQLLSYHIAAHRGLDVDQPRNLAKSVTVE